MWYLLGILSSYFLYNKKYKKKYNWGQFLIFLVIISSISYFITPYLCSIIVGFLGYDFYKSYNIFNRAFKNNKDNLKRTIETYLNFEEDELNITEDNFKIKSHPEYSKFIEIPIENFQSMKGSELLKFKETRNFFIKYNLPEEPLKKFEYRKITMIGLSIEMGFPYITAFCHSAGTLKNFKITQIEYLIDYEKTYLKSNLLDYIKRNLISLIDEKYHNAINQSLKNEAFLKMVKNEIKDEKLHIL